MPSKLAMLARLPRPPLRPVGTPTRRRRRRRRGEWGAGQAERRGGGFREDGGGVRGGDAMCVEVFIKVGDIVVVAISRRAIGVFPENWAVRIESEKDSPSC